MTTKALRSVNRLVSKWPTLILYRIHIHRKDFDETIFILNQIWVAAVWTN
ncbi:hypothetical protein N9I19_17220 [Peribacillus sp. CSMR9]|nr:hypothetical protein [Peribacillus sp. CSMR9]